MKTHDVQSVSIKRPIKVVFEYIADPQNLPDWTNAFARADAETADLVTPNGTVAIRLNTKVDSTKGTIDWEMIFPDGSVGTAYSRVSPEGNEGSIYTFLLMAPPVPLELLEGALKEQMTILAGELANLKSKLEG